VATALASSVSVADGSEPSKCWIVSIKENFAVPFVPVFDKTDELAPSLFVPYPLLFVPRPAVILAAAGPPSRFAACTWKSRDLAWQSVHCFFMTTVDCAASAAAARWLFWSCAVVLGGVTNPAASFVHALQTTLPQKLQWCLPRKALNFLMQHPHAFVELRG